MFKRDMLTGFRYFKIYDIVNEFVLFLIRLINLG